MTASIGVLFVCTGNICRSPMAERLLRTRLAELDVDDAVVVSSAGLGARDGWAMDPFAKEELQRLDVDASRFRSHRLHAAMAERASLVLTATTDHRDAVAALAPASLRTVFTWRELVHLLHVRATEAALSEEPSDSSLSGQLASLRDLRGLYPPASLSDFDEPDPYGGPRGEFTVLSGHLVAAVGKIAALLSSVVHATSRDA